MEKEKLAKKKSVLSGNPAKTEDSPIVDGGVQKVGDIIQEVLDHSEEVDDEKREIETNESHSDPNEP